MAYCVGLEVLSWIVDAQRLRLTIIVLGVLGGGGGTRRRGCWSAGGDALFRRVPLLDGRFGLVPPKPEAGSCGPCLNLR